jgi:hypothetical protein
MAACIEGGGGNGGWRIIDPGAHPVPQPVSNLETAKRQAETVALWALPLDEKTAARQRAAILEGPLLRQNCFASSAPFFLPASIISTARPSHVCSSVSVTTSLTPMNRSQNSTYPLR